MKKFVILLGTIFLVSCGTSPQDNVVSTNEASSLEISVAKNQILSQDALTSSGMIEDDSMEQGVSNITITEDKDASVDSDNF